MSANSADMVPDAKPIGPRERAAQRVFELRRRQLDDASRRMIAATIELRDSRAGADAQYKW